ncbi:MAG: tetratricopeptide repeat protein, partial [Kiritimatiellae bacterium]|nr:tetratricopeptide repeat protein [Kiritimatiellia bacterium]
LFSRGLYKQAAVEFERFLADFPESADSARAAFRLGESLRLCGDREGAAKAYRRAAEIPGSEFRAKALFKRASIFADLGLAEAADELFAALLAEDPPQDVAEMALYYHASCLESLGRSDAAKTRLERLLSDYPESSMAAFAKLSLAHILSESSGGGDGLGGDGESLVRARALLREVAENPPDDRLGAEALYLTAVLERAQGHDEAAAEAFSLLFSRYPGDIRAPEARVPAAWSFCRANRMLDAIECADEALRASPAPSARDAAQLRYARAQALFQLARYDEAAEWFAKLAEDADSGLDMRRRARYQAALSLFKGGKFAASRRMAGDTDKDSGLRADTLWLRAQAASREAEQIRASGAGDPAEATDVAIEALRRLSSEFPERDGDDDALYRLGELLRSRGALDDANAAFSALVERHPGSRLAPQALFSSASALSASGRNEEALARWQTFVRDFPDSAGAAEAGYQAGMALMRLKRKTEALQTFSNLAKSLPAGEPRRADSLFWRGVVLSDAGRFEEAAAAFREALAQTPSSSLAADARFALAETLRLSGKPEEAVAEYAPILAAPGGAARFSPQLLAWLSSAQFDAGAFADAAQTALRMADAAAGDPALLQEAWTLAGRAERSLGRMREAEAHFEKAFGEAAATEYFAEAALRLGEARLARGDAAGSIPCFAVAAERCDSPQLKPWRVWAYIGLGRASLATGDAESAANDLSTVCLLYHAHEVLQPVFDEAIDVLLKLGRKDEARVLRETKERDYSAQ